ncbi:hypothetical protein QYE76_035128 [Lolium multiflorum]|uniref:Reverse transcriptase Ty1/copia-type domain-containing protein n=1 Tax=Lolium multiflorum TaxID=4521 RepID=A0AAD8QZW0_LOLMU|nr:hypothetical protein QYE76_035128 [Lolium multiflorum]
MASSTSMSATALAAALGSPPSQPLTRENALVWKALVIPALRGARVLDLVEGKDTAPAESISAEDANNKPITIVNPDYEAWISRDQQVLRWLLNALSPDVLAHVVGLDSSSAVWAALNAHVSGQSKTRVQQLRSALNDTRKGDMSAEKYVAKMKCIAAELAAVGKPLDDDELVYYVLQGLGSHYNNLRTAVNANPNTTLAELLTQVQAFDRQHKSDEPGFTSSANVARRDTRPRHDRRHDRRSARIAPAKMTGLAMMIGGARIAHARSTVTIAHVAMMMIAAAAMMAAAMMVVAAAIDAPRPMSMSPAKSATYMGILLGTAGGAMMMIVPTALTVVIVATKLNKLTTYDPYPGEDRVRTARHRILLLLVKLLLQMMHPRHRSLSLMILLMAAHIRTLALPLPTPLGMDPEDDPPASPTLGSRAASSAPEEDPVASARSSPATSLSHARGASPSPPRTPAPAATSTPDGASAVQPPAPAAPLPRPRTRLQQGEPRNLPAALNDPNWRDAMQEEYNALLENKTWTLVPSSPNKNLIDCKWVYRIKRRADGTIDRYKARLVAKDLIKLSMHSSRLLEHGTLG